MKEKSKKAITTRTLFQSNCIKIVFAFPLLSIGTFGIHKGFAFCFVGPFVIWFGRGKI